MVISYFFVVEIELCQKIIAGPGIIGKTIVIGIVAIEVNVLIPVQIRAVFPSLTDIFKSKEVSAAVIENSVQNDFNALCVAIGNQPFEVFIVAEPRVELSIITRLIAMSDRLK